MRARRPLNRPKRRLSARASMAMTYQASGWLADALGWLAVRLKLDGPNAKGAGQLALSNLELYGKVCAAGLERPPR